MLVRQEGNRQVRRNIDHYNLDMVIALGYRVQSQVATRFRRWATQRLHEYIQKGFAMDDERLKQGGNRYFRELLQRIRDIRSSERNFCQQVADIYAFSTRNPERYVAACGSCCRRPMARERRGCFSMWDGSFRSVVGRWAAV